MNTNEARHDAYDENVDAAQLKTIFSCWSEALKRFVDFSGRTTKYEFWAFQTVNIILFMFFLFLGWLFNAYDIMFEIYGLYLITPLTTASLRRLHDADISGTLVLPFTVLSVAILINLEFAVVSQFLLIFLWLSYFSYLCTLLVLDGNRNDNLYGVKIPEAAIYNNDSVYFIRFMFIILALAWIVFFIKLF